MFKRALNQLGCILCAIFLIPSAAWAESNSRFAMAGFDGDDSAHVWETNAFFTRMQERTGIEFSFEEYTDFDEWQAAQERMFETGQLPDVLFKAELTTEELIRYTDSGQLIDLKPLLEENAPHLWALLKDNEDWLSAITLPNGKIGALPSISTLPPQNAMWINQDWLDKLHLDMPSDAESLREVLRAFKERDPNQNGKQDEVPFTFLGVWDLKFLSHAFGLVANDYNIFVDEEGKVRYLPEEDQFTKLLVYLRDLYAEKLLDSNGFYTTDVLRSYTDQDTTVTYGVYFGPNPLTLYSYEQGKQYVLLQPLEYEGKRVYRDLYSEITRGTFAITSACEDPAALLRWVDILYTEEGAIEAVAGKEGLDYTVDEDGRWEWKDGIENVSTTTLNEVSVYDTGNMPLYFPLEFYNRFTMDEIERINGELTKLERDLVKPFPTYSLTSEQSARILPLQNELGQYVDESFAKFVIGQWEINDETIARFREGLQERGAQEFTAFWQTVYNQRQR